MSDHDNLGPDGDLSEEEADALLEQLEFAINETAAVPPWLTRFAYESHRLVSFEGELAEISADSALAAVGNTRSTGGLRVIDFSADGLAIRVEVEGLTGRGSVEPAGPEMHLVYGDADHHLEVNRRGFFSFEVPDGPFRLLADLGDRKVRTDWVTLR